MRSSEPPVITAIESPFKIALYPSAMAAIPEQSSIKGEDNGPAILKVEPSHANGMFLGNCSKVPINWFYVIFDHDPPLTYYSIVFSPFVVPNVPPAKAIPLDLYCS